MTVSYREHCRRTHRILGQFLAIEAWLRGVDCIVLERYELGRYLGLEKFQDARIGWLKKDLTPWFPHQMISWDTKLEDVLLSRVPIEKSDFAFAANTEARLAILERAGIATQIFDFEVQLSSEAEIVGYLAQLSSGLLAPDYRPKGHEQIEPETPVVARKPARKIVR